MLSRFETEEEVEGHDYTKGYPPEAPPWNCTCRQLLVLVVISKCYNFKCSPRLLDLETIDVRMHTVLPSGFELGPYSFTYSFTSYYRPTGR